MRWVKLTLPPRARRRWLLITMRLSASSLAGTARTLVAVGTSSDACHVGHDRAARRAAAACCRLGRRRAPPRAWSRRASRARAWPARASRGAGLAGGGLGCGFGGGAARRRPARGRGRGPAPVLAAGAAPALPRAGRGRRRRCRRRWPRRRPLDRARRPGSAAGTRPGGSRRRSRARPRRRWSGRRGNARTCPRRATRWRRNRPCGAGVLSVALSLLARVGRCHVVRPSSGRRRLVATTARLRAGHARRACRAGRVCAR